MVDDNTDPVGQAAQQIQEQATEKPKRKPRTPKPEPQPEPVVQEVVVTFSGIGPEDVSKAVAVLLAALAVRTKTEGPSKEEVDSISSGIAVGLQNTKVAIDPKTGPWIPLALAATAYALPRIFDVVLRTVENREAAKRGPFREPSVISPSVPTGPERE